MPYETKPMKKQWITVEGRMTPIVLPQIWNHELQDWVVTSEQNPLPTQLYGSDVEQEVVTKKDVMEVVLERNTRTSSVVNVTLSVPDGAKSATIETTIRGVTGSFEDGEGVSIVVYGRNSQNTVSITEARTEKTTHPNLVHQIIIDKFVKDELLTYYRNEIAVENTPILTRYRFDLSINGTFDTGQGIDTEVRVIWAF